MYEKFENVLQSINWQIDPITLYRPIEYALRSGGKRLRPSLVGIACEMFNGDYKNTENAAIAIEIFHNFTLLHDDMMDDSPTRRNMETVHKKWNSNTAILSGDAMLIKSYEFLSKIPQKYWTDVFPLFTKTALQVCEGQRFDMDFETMDDVTIEQYFEMIRLKTAVLLACSLKIGAILADAPQKECDLLYDFGIALGIAFQLKDDYLDTFGDSDMLGKRIGGDILCRKKTFLLLSALTIADEDIQKLIKIIINSKIDTDEEKICQISEIYINLSIPSICEQEIGKYYKKAKYYLKNISLPEKNKENLGNLVEKLQIRQK
ncbi:MAG: polyprenyl synthetase family protein [Prevotellaceae bacterium]|nr:polyprenyl synthetase family protein [Prevotellaceae bacterium]